MDQYKIVATKYSEAGALTNEKEVIYRDNVEQSEQTYNNLSSLKYENGGKMYKVEFFAACYKKFDDAAAFFDQFKA